MSRTTRHGLRRLGMKAFRMLDWKMFFLALGDESAAVVHEQEAPSLVPRIHIKPRRGSGYITLALGDGLDKWISRTLKPV